MRGGIMTRPKDIDWDKVEDLGKVPDPIIAKRLGCGRASVLRARTIQGIAACEPFPDWTRVSDLGKIWDSVIAKRLGIKIATVHSARKRLGISPYKETYTCICCGKTKETQQKNAHLCSENCGSALDRAVKILGADNRAELSIPLLQAHLKLTKNLKEYTGIGGQLGINWDAVTVLGKFSDAKIAQIIGCSRTTVKQARRRRGIPLQTRQENTNAVQQSQCPHEASR
jgi:hypothetical protein